jgi:hypothetical protein
VPEDPADSNAAGVLHYEDHEQYQRSRQKRCREIQRGPATVTPGPRLTGLLNFGHERRLPQARAEQTVLDRDGARSLAVRQSSRGDGRFASWAIEGAMELSFLARVMGTSVRELEDTYFRWLTRTDDQLRAALDAYDAAAISM